MATPTSGTDLMRRFVPTSPFVAYLGIEVVRLGDGEAVLRLPYREQVVTIGEVVHGGAISTLIDTAAMAAAWSGAEVPDPLRGATVSLAVSFVAPAEGEAVTATASVVRRGRKLVNLRVDASTESGTPVASALVTYQIG